MYIAMQSTQSSLNLICELTETKSSSNTDYFRGEANNTTYALFKSAYHNGDDTKPFYRLMRCPAGTDTMELITGLFKNKSKNGNEYFSAKVKDRRMYLFKTKTDSTFRLMEKDLGSGQ